MYPNNKDIYYTLIIQKNFKGKHVRNKIKNIFYKLPDDLQRKIIFYIRESYLLEKYHYKIIRNIISNKVQENTFNNIINNYISYNVFESLDIDKVNYIYYLFTKYNQIVPLDKIWFLKNKVFYFKHLPSFYNQNDIKTNISLIRMYDTIVNFQHTYGLIR